MVFLFYSYRYPLRFGTSLFLISCCAPSSASCICGQAVGASYLWLFCGSLVINCKTYDSVNDYDRIILQCNYAIADKFTYTSKHQCNTSTVQETQLPQRNSASAVHVYLGWLTDRAMHRTPQNRRGCTISDIQTL